MNIDDRVKVLSGHLRGHFGTITETDNGDGVGVAIDHALVFVRIPATDLRVAKTRQQQFVAGTRPLEQY